MLKLENKFFTLFSLTAAGFLFSGIFLFYTESDFRNYLGSEKIVPVFLKNYVISHAIQNELKNPIEFSQDEMKSKIESSLRQHGMPYLSAVVATNLKTYGQVSNLKIYDESYRLIYSDEKDFEVFNKELRSSDHAIIAGSFSKLGEFILYRTLDGLYFLKFKIMQKKSIVRKLDLPFQCAYWVFSKKKNTFIFSSEPSVSFAEDHSNFLKDLQGKVEIEKFTNDDWFVFYKNEKPDLSEILFLGFKFVVNIFLFVSIAFSLSLYILWMKNRLDENLLIEKAFEIEKLSGVFEKLEKKMRRKLSNHA